MFSQIICLWLALLLALGQGLRIEESQEFPLGSEVENLALRPSGSVLAVVYTFPRIYEVAPRANSKPKLLHTFENTNGVSSIAASSTPDVYHLITGNFTFGNLTPTAESYAIHRLCFDKHDKPIVKELARLDKISQPNGMLNVPNTPYVLIADTREGFIYRFNTETLELTTYFDHPLLKPQPQPPGIIFGVNGIKLSRGYLYFSNTNRQFVARVKATGRERRLVGKPEIVATQTAVDDLIVNDYNGDLYLAQLGTNSTGLVRNRARSTVPKTLLGGPSSQDILGPTSLIWAKGAVGRKLIISVNGDFSQFATGVFTGGGKLKFVDLDQHY